MDSKHTRMNFSHIREDNTTEMTQTFDITTPTNKPMKSLGLSPKKNNKTYLSKQMEIFTTVTSPKTEPRRRLVKSKHPTMLSPQMMILLA